MRALARLSEQRAYGLRVMGFLQEAAEGVDAGRSYPGAVQAPTRSPFYLWCFRGSQGRFGEHGARPAARGPPTGLDGFGPRSSQVQCRELVSRDAEHLVLGHRQDHSGAPMWGGCRTRTAGRGMFLPYGTGGARVPRCGGAARRPPRGRCIPAGPAALGRAAQLRGVLARLSREFRGAARVGEARPRGAPGRRLRGRPERRALPAAPG